MDSMLVKVSFNIENSRYLYISANGGFSPDQNNYLFYTHLQYKAFKGYY